MSFITRKAAKFEELKVSENVSLEGRAKVYPRSARAKLKPNVYAELVPEVVPGREMYFSVLFRSHDNSPFFVEFEDGLDFTAYRKNPLVPLLDVLDVFAEGTFQKMLAELVCSEIEGSARLSIFLVHDRKRGGLGPEAILEIKIRNFDARAVAKLESLIPFLEVEGTEKFDFE